MHPFCHPAVRINGCTILVKSRGNIMQAIEWSGPVGESTKRTQSSLSLHSLRAFRSLVGLQHVKQIDETNPILPDWQELAAS
jgi:hypothetical protein